MFCQYKVPNSTALALHILYEGNSTILWFISVSVYTVQLKIGQNHKCLCHKKISGFLSNVNLLYSKMSLAKKEEFFIKWNVIDFASLCQSTLTYRGLYHVKCSELLLYQSTWSSSCIWHQKISRFVTGHSTLPHRPLTRKSINICPVFF